MPEIDNMTARQCENLLTAECFYYDKSTRSFKEYGIFAHVVLLRNHYENITGFFKKVAWKLFTGEALISNADIARRLATLLETTVDEAEVAKLKLLAKRAMLCVGDQSPQGQELKQALLVASTDIQPSSKAPNRIQSDISTPQIKRMLIKTSSTFKETLLIHIRRFGFFLSTGSIITNRILADSILNTAKAKNINLELEEISDIFTLTEELQAQLHNYRDIFQTIGKIIVKKIDPSREVFSEPEIITINNLARSILPHITDERLAQEINGIDEWIELSQESSSESSEDEEGIDNLQEFTPLRHKIKKEEPKVIQPEKIEKIEEIEEITIVPPPPKFEKKIEEKKKAPPLPNRKQPTTGNGPIKQPIPLNVKGQIEGLRKLIDSDNDSDFSMTPTPKKTTRAPVSLKKSTNSKLLSNVGNSIKKKSNQPNNPPSSVVKVLFQDENAEARKLINPKDLINLKLRKIERKEKTPQKNSQQSLALMIDAKTKLFSHSPAKQEGGGIDDSW